MQTRLLTRRSSLQLQLRSNLFPPILFRLSCGIVSGLPCAIVLKLPCPIISGVSCVIVSGLDIRFHSPNDMINQSSIDVVYRSSIDIAYRSSIDVVIHSGRGKTYDILQGKGRNVRENGGEITLICCFNITKCIKTLVVETFFFEKCWLLNIYFLPLH